MEKIKQADIDYLQKRIKEKYGYKKFIASWRYGYIGIDEFDKDGNCLNTYRTGLTKREAWYILRALLDG